MGVVLRIQGQPVVAGDASGMAMVADTPLSFWGGYDSDTGEIIDRRHTLSGSMAAGRVLVIPAGRGSCSGSGVLLEAIRNGTAPAVIVISRVDPIICLGAILGDELYGSHPIVTVICAQARRQIVSGDTVTVNRNGQITVNRGIALTPVDAPISGQNPVVSDR